MRTIRARFGKGEEKAATALFCVGAGRANEGLRADWQEQLRRVRSECGFRYIRMHALFHDDMGVCKKTKDGRILCNWQYIDALYDFLLSIGMKPFVELSFTPAAMASGPETIFWWKGNVSIPVREEWKELVGGFVRHVTERYGEDEVRSWYFECWNEPDLSAFFAGTQEDYFRLYADTAQAVKGVCADYRTGGPATSGCKWIGEFIAYCVRTKTPVDFIATHTYGVTQGALDEWGESGTVLSPDRRSIIREVEEVRNRIRSSALPGLELHFTEWSSSYTPSDPMHDAYHSAAYILDKLKNTERVADSMSYWVFTDIFEEAGPRFTPFHGGFGLVNYQGIRKSAYYAYKYLRHLGETVWENDDSASWVCQDAQGGLQVLFWDFTITHPGTETTNQVYYRQDLPSREKESVRIHLSGLEPGKYSLGIRRTGYRRNDPYTFYLAMGSPEQLTRNEVSFLQSKSADEPEDFREVIVESDGEFRTEIPLRENDVVLLMLTRLILIS